MEEQNDIIYWLVGTIAAAIIGFIIERILVTIKFKPFKIFSKKDDAYKNLDEEYLLKLEKIIINNSEIFFNEKDNKLFNSYMKCINLFENETHNSIDEDIMDIRDHIRSFRIDYSNYLNKKDSTSSVYLTKIFIRVLKLIYNFSTMTISDDKENCKDLFRGYYMLIDWIINNSNNIKFAEKEICENLKKIIEYCYVDLSDAKLKRDIRQYEPYSGYWVKSESWIYEILKKRIKKFRKDKKILTVLDIGCGDGRLIDCLAEQDDNIFAIDPDIKRLEKARIRLKRRFHNIKLYPESFGIAATHFKNNFFDLIICSHVLQHIHTDEAKLFIKLIHKILKPSGLCILMVPISKSNWDEYVVEGYECDILHFTKKYFKLLKKSYQLDHKLINYLNNNGFDLSEQDWYISKKDTNNGFYKISNHKDESNYYEIIYRENNVRIYKHLPSLGLQMSLNRNYIKEFTSSIISEKLKNEFQINNLALPASSLIICNNHSTHWIIFSEELSKRNLSIIVENNKTTTKKIPVAKIISNHYLVDLKQKKIPSPFETELKKKYSKIILSKISVNKWDLITIENNEHVASIYKTENYLSLAYKKNEEYYIQNLNINALNYNEIPEDIIKANSINSNELKYIKIDPEIYNYWFIVKDHNILYVIRDDYDWIKVFKPDHIFYELILGQISEKFKEKLYPMKILSSSKIVCNKDGKNEWYIFQDKTLNEIQPNNYPDYTILKYPDNRNVFVSYRHKRYNWISQDTFNFLCSPTNNIYKILPTRHFSKKTLYSILKGFNIECTKLTQILKPKKYNILDKIILRDKIFNWFLFKNSILLCRKFKVQNISIIINKKINK